VRRWAGAHWGKLEKRGWGEALSRATLSRRSLFKMVAFYCAVFKTKPDKACCGDSPLIDTNKIKLCTAATSVHARGLVCAEFE